MNLIEKAEQAKELEREIQNLQEEINDLTSEVIDNQSKMSELDESIRAASTLIKEKQQKQQSLNEARKELRNV